MATARVINARRNVYDEFCMRFQEIEAEVNAYLEYDPNTLAGKTILLSCDDPEWSNFTLYFAQNFKKLGLKKLISTSYFPANAAKTSASGTVSFESGAELASQAKIRKIVGGLHGSTVSEGILSEFCPSSKNICENSPYMPMLFDGEVGNARCNSIVDNVGSSKPGPNNQQCCQVACGMNFPKIDAEKEHKNGKIFILDHDINKDGRVDIDDIEWGYLDGDGDFRSEEVTKLRDESDIICTFPPFSLFSEFFNWINAGDRKYLIVGSNIAFVYKDVFPLFRENKVRFGATGKSRGLMLYVPDDYLQASSKYEVDSINGRKCTLVPGIRWMTNLDHGRRKEPLVLMTKADNLKYSKHKELRGKIDYDHYDNYDAIDVPYVDAIPLDYDGVMGVPFSFLSKYNPEQFEIVGLERGDDGKYLEINGKRTYIRILIKHKRQNVHSMK